MNMLKKIVYGFFVVFLIGCVTQIHQHNLSQLDKGISQNEAFTRLESPAISTNEIIVNGRSFVFDQYNLNTGMISSPYYLVYEGGKLLYWGYVSEFKRNQDISLVTAMEKLQAKLEAENKSK